MEEDSALPAWQRQHNKTHLMYFQVRGDKKAAFLSLAFPFPNTKQQKKVSSFVHSTARSGGGATLSCLVSPELNLVGRADRIADSSTTVPRGDLWLLQWHCVVIDKKLQ